MFTSSTPLMQRLNLTEVGAGSACLHGFSNPIDWYTKQPQPQKTTIT